MYCGSGLYTDIPHSISNNMVLPVTLFLPLFLFPPDALRVRVSLGVSGVQCLTRSVFIPPEKCYCVYCMGCGVRAAPATWGLLMNNLYVCWTPRIFPKKHDFHSVLHLICFHSPSRGHERSWPAFLHQDAICASLFSCFYRISLTHHFILLFDSSSCCPLAQQRALFTTSCPFLKS